MAKIHFTVTDFSPFYGLTPFDQGQVVYLRKGEDNYDAEAIAVHIPYIGNIGYVANSPEDVIRGTISGGRLYDHFKEVAVAKVEFITSSAVICSLVSPTKAKKYLALYNEYVSAQKDDGFVLTDASGEPFPVSLPIDLVEITPIWKK